MRTTTWRRRGSEPGSGTEAQLWARPPLAAVGSVDQEPRVWRGACGSHPALWIQREERAGRPRLLAGLWRPGPFGGITALRGARGGWGLVTWTAFLALQWPRCVPGGVGSGRYCGPGLSAPSPARGLRPVWATNQASHVRVCALGPSGGTTMPGRQEVGVCWVPGLAVLTRSHSLGLSPSSVTLSEAPAALCCSFRICEMGTVMSQSF